MLAYIDIHTHQKTRDSNVFAITNQIIGREETLDSICSTGIHPWYIDNIQLQYDELQRTLINPNVLAVGECGLDKVCSTAWEVQIQVFRKQIQLANAIDKPLIIHCVRAYEEVLQLLKEENNKVPILFHGVNKKYPLIQSLIKQNHYVSLGAFILDGHHDDTIKNIDLTKFFLETDNKSTDIVDIYSYFCRVRNMSIEQLKSQLVQNLSKAFNYTIVP